MCILFDITTAAVPGMTDLPFSPKLHMTFMNEAGAIHWQFEFTVVIFAGFFLLSSLPQHMGEIQHDSSNYRHSL